MKRLTLSLFFLLTFIGGMVSAAPREQQLKIYNWADYIDESLLDEFKLWYEEQTGEKVDIIYQVFDINEVMLSKIEKGHEDFDLICPSDYIIERMLKAGLLLPIEKDFGQTPDYTTNISPYVGGLLANVDGSGLNPADYAVPYMWGSTGIMYNPKYVSAEEVKTWDVLKDPKYADKILMKEAFRDVYTMFNIALHREEILSGELTVDQVARDFSAESISEVEAYLDEMKDNIGGWEVDFGKEMMTKEKYYLNFTWSGDAAWAMEEAAAVGVELEYAIPDGGILVWFDAWAIPKYAKNVKAARYFINFLCMEENALRNMDAVGYVSAIGGAKILEAMTDEESYAPIDVSYFFGEEATAACVDPVYYPDASYMKFSGMEHDGGTEELMAMWSRVKGDNANSLTVIIVAALVVVAAAFFILSGRKNRKRRLSRR